MPWTGLKISGAGGRVWGLAATARHREHANDQLRPPPGSGRLPPPGRADRPHGGEGGGNHVRCLRGGERPPRDREGPREDDPRVTLPNLTTGRRLRRCEGGAGPRPPPPPPAGGGEGGSGGGGGSPPRRFRFGARRGPSGPSRAHPREAERPPPPDVDPDCEPEGDPEGEDVARPRPLRWRRDRQDLCGDPARDEDGERGPEVPDAAQI